jgi:hypothetical protein
MSRTLKDLEPAARHGVGREADPDWTVRGVVLARGGTEGLPPQRPGLFTNSGVGSGGLLAWAERSGRRPAAGVRRGGLRLAFYGRVSTLWGSITRSGLVRLAGWDPR